MILRNYSLFVLNGQLHLSISESYSLWILGLLHGYAALRALAPRHSFWPSTSQPRGINCDTRSGQTVHIKRPNGKVWNGQTWRWLVPVDQRWRYHHHPPSQHQPGRLHCGREDFFSSLTKLLVFLVESPFLMWKSVVTPRSHRHHPQ